jgi:hypothetical protein
MRLESATAPATVIDDESYKTTLYKGEGKIRMNHKSGDLPKFGI